MNTHRNPRVHIVPGTRQIEVRVGRAFDDHTQEIECVTLTLCRKEVDGFKAEGTWTAYDGCDGIVKFEVPCEFTTSPEYPRGLYYATVKVGDCVLGCLEIVKAPGLGVLGASADSEACDKDKWCEPTCKVPEPKKQDCEPKEGCPGSCDIEETFEPTYLEEPTA